MWNMSFWLLSLFLCCGCRANDIVSCRNEKGDPVDWYILYKLPSISGDNGRKYLYMDGGTSGWVNGSKTIDDKESAVARTLQPLFAHKRRKTEKFGFILYSDQPPRTFRAVSPSYGHSKGILLMDKETGVWISHSIPRFPGNTEKTFWPASGFKNGQTFFCGTYIYSEFQNIAVQLKYIHIFAFDYDIPKTFYSELQCVTQKGCYPKEEPWFRQLNLTSLAGNKFVSYAKYSRLGNDLYTGLLEQYLGDDLYAKSWGKMRRPLPTNCTVQHNVFNVQIVQLSTLSFDVNVDHSKWCVTVGKGTGQWTCIADMNREVSQEHRGGGAVCTDQLDVWKAFVNAVHKYEPCPFSSKKHASYGFEKTCHVLS